MLYKFLSWINTELKNISAAISLIYIITHCISPALHQYRIVAHQTFDLSWVFKMLPDEQKSKSAE